jgi:non-specific serine/threonine protein kinase/serine/threonine-protein kinase
MTPERWQQVKGVLQDVLELNDPQRSTFLEQACQGDATLRLEVESLLAEERASADGFLNPLQLDAAVFAAGPDDSWVGSRLGPYQVVAKIGEGGMGAVYRAVRADEQYEKQVAIKIVRHGLDSAFALARFRAERQILANLDHPNIGRLLDGGTTDNGLPYLVMELVEGIPIDHYCNSHELPIHERLRLFLLVCSAVQYAHQRLVIHRDLKPGNILVTADGTPKLLDFGIAKILEPGSAPEAGEPTVSMLRMLTPEYASPEQIRGETVTTASDVYSLGVVLYLLLTGQRPYKLQNHSPETLVRAVCETEPAKPSTAVRWTKAGGSDESEPVPAGNIQTGDDSSEKLSKRLRGDLDNIVLMALRKDPQRRFASADHFAEDIRRYLQDLPVTARTDSFRYRASKFILRHKRGVMAAGLVVLMVIGLMAAIARQAHIARVHRERAERRFQDVRELASSLIFDVHDSIQDLAGATAARKLIVAKALQYLDSLTQESQGDSSLRRELAEAYKRIGDVQGNEFSANLGDTSNALKSYQKALAIREELWATDKGNIAEALSLAELYRLVSQTQQFAGQLSPALETGRKSVDLMEPIERSHPDDPKVVFELLADYQTVANILGGDLGLSNLGDNDAAMVYRQKQLDAAEHFAMLDGNGMKGKGNLAIAISTMGDQLWQGGDIDLSLQHYLRAKPLFEEVAFRSSKSARGRYLLGLLYERITAVQLAKGNLDQAYAAANEALKLSKALNAADPRDVQSGNTLVLDQKLVADVESRRGHREIAAAELRKGMAQLPHLVALSPQDTEVLATEADMYTGAGDLARRSGDFRTALKHYEQAIAVLSKLVAENAGNAGAARRLAGIYNYVGRVQQKSHFADSAEQAYQKALGLAEAASSGHSNMQAVYVTADAYTGLGEVESMRAIESRLSRVERIEHWQRAVSWYSRSADMWKRVKQPGLVSPDGFESVPPNIVLRRLSECQERLRQPSVASN